MSRQVCQLASPDCALSYSKIWLPNGRPEPVPHLALRVHLHSHVTMDLKHVIIISADVSCEHLSQTPAGGLIMRSYTDGWPLCRQATIRFELLRQAEPHAASPEAVAIAAGCA